LLLGHTDSTRCDHVNNIPHDGFLYTLLLRGLAVAQLFEALRYKPYGLGFHWNFTLIQSFRLG